MLRIEIAKNEFFFKNSFDKITVKEFALNSVKDNEIAKILEQVESHSKTIEEFEKIKTPQAIAEITYLDAVCLDLLADVRMRRIEQIAIICATPKKFENFMLTTKGIDDKLFARIYNRVNKCFAGFEEYFAKLNAIQSFRFEDYKRSGFFRQRSNNFFVADLDKQTLLRDTAATIVAQKIGTMRSEFEQNNWTNLARFCAFVCRPKREKYEFLPDSPWYSFIGGKSFQSLPPSDRLARYNQNLEDTVKERSQVFEKLPLSTALGIYKYYFFLKKNFPTNTKDFTKAIRKQRKKQSFTNDNSERKQALKT